VDSESFEKEAGNDIENMESGGKEELVEVKVKRTWMAAFGIFLWGQIGMGNIASAEKAIIETGKSLGRTLDIMGFSLVEEH
jgi:hypothetical protein